MKNKRNTFSILGAGIAVIAVGIAASARPAAAQPPLLSHPAQVRQVFGDWNHNSDQDRNHARSQDRNQDRSQDSRQDRGQDRRRAEQARREAERARAERARHEAEVRHAQWLREHRSDRDRNHDQNRDRDHNQDRSDLYRDGLHDNR